MSPSDITNFSQKIFDPPVGRLIGFRVTQSANGQATVEIDVDERHANPMGTLHGGILCDIADMAMGAALVSTLQPGETFTTLEMKINFLRPVWKAKLFAIGKVVKGGRIVSLVECDVFDSEQKLVARASSTCMTLRGDQATGR
jgi:uncharacterized protein (TIGR00369 family)